MTADVVFGFPKTLQHTRLSALVFFLTVQAVQSVQGGGGRRRGGQEEKPARRRKRGGGGGKEEEKRRRRGKRRRKKRRRRGKGRGKEEEEGERRRKRGGGGEKEEEKRKQLIDFHALELVLHPKRAHFQRGIVHSDSEKANFSPAAPRGRKQGEKGH